MKNKFLFLQKPLSFQAKKLPKTKNKKNIDLKNKYKNELGLPLIINFDNLDELANCCKNLFYRFSHLILKTYLYRYKLQYVLIIYTYYKLEKKIAVAASEFGDLIGKSEIKHSFYQEHGKLLIPKNAIEKVVDLT